MAYKMYVECSDGLKTIPIANKDGELIYETNIENFDMVTAQYKDAGEFFADMAKKGRLTSSPIKIPYILGTSKTAVKKGVVFNSNILKDFAKKLYYERNNGLKLKDIHLSKNSETAHLTQKLKAYAVLEDTRGKTINSKYMPYVIKQELSDYVKIMEKPQQDYVDKDEILQITDKIESLLTNYTILRAVAFWQQNLLKKLEKEKSNANVQGQIKHNLTVENSAIDYESQDIAIYKQIEKENSDILQQMADEKNDKFEKKYREIENPEMKKLYENGGLEAVLNNMDTNELYKDSAKNDREAMGMEDGPRKK